MVPGPGISAEVGSHRGDGDLHLLVWEYWGLVAVDAVKRGQSRGGIREGVVGTFYPGVL